MVFYYRVRFLFFGLIARCKFFIFCVRVFFFIKLKSIKFNKTAVQKKCSDIAQSDRGGDVTYHGPGQLVCYPIINLNNYNKSITWYIELIEKSIIKVLEQNKITAIKKESPLVGIWVDDEKIAAIGVRLSRWISTHGFAINVNTDLSYFDGIIP